MSKLLTCLTTCLILLGNASCQRSPELTEHNRHKDVPIIVEMPEVNMDLAVIWDYAGGFDYNVPYEWEKEWIYGWDEKDERFFGPIGYTAPNTFQLREYYYGTQWSDKRQSVKPATVTGTHHTDRFETGYYDMLAWSETEPLSGIYSLHFEEPDLDSPVTAYTNPAGMTGVTRGKEDEEAIHYQPDELFAGMVSNVHISEDPADYDYRDEQGVYHKRIALDLRPATYIYLTQVVLHNNQKRIALVDGNAALTGMARTTDVNTQVAGHDAVSVYYNVIKKDQLTTESGEQVDVIGGRLLTFGIPGLNPWTVTRGSKAADNQSHYLLINVTYSNGSSGALRVNVTDQIRIRYKGGVITVHINVDDLDIPKEEGDSGFDVTILPTEEEKHIIEI